MVVTSGVIGRMGLFFPDRAKLCAPGIRRVRFTPNTKKDRFPAPLKAEGKTAREENVRSFAEDAVRGRKDRTIAA
jgi:hypothetical protein